jgi:hypothetical protein
MTGVAYGRRYTGFLHIGLEVNRAVVESRVHSDTRVKNLGLVSGSVCSLCMVWKPEALQKGEFEDKRCRNLHSAAGASFPVILTMHLPRKLFVLNIVNQSLLPF